MNNISRIKRSLYGFTMVELLIVIVVLAILTVVSGTTYVATMKTTRDGKRKIDLENIRSALEVYRSDNSTYPVTSTYPLVTTLRSLLDPDPASGNKKYITLPTDPKNKLDYYYEPKDCTTVGPATICNSYILAVALENTPTVAVPSACSSLKLPPDNKVYVCKSTSGDPTKCSYCLDPYGQVSDSVAVPSVE